MTDSKILFLCTGNYYRSRFAEAYFCHLAKLRGLDWQAESRGLRISGRNVGPISSHTVTECERLGIPVTPERIPIRVTKDDFRQATRTIAVKETEHRPLMHENFPDWVDRIEYWEVHDLDVAQPPETFQALRQHVEQLVDELAARRAG